MKIKKKQKNIVFVGKLNESKGYDLYSDSIIKILNEFKDWKAFSIGDEDRRKIYIKHKNRFMNIDIEKTEQKLSYELNKHKKLLDMRSKLIEKKLINTDIKKSLGMEIPSKKKIIYLDLVE